MLRTLTVEEIAFVSGGEMEDDDYAEERMSEDGSGGDSGEGYGGDYGGDDSSVDNGYSEASDARSSGNSTQGQSTTESPSVGHTAADAAVCLGSIGLAVGTDGASAFLGGVVGLGSCYVAGEDVVNRLRAGGYLNSK